MTRNTIRWNHPLASRECEDGDTAIFRPGPILRTLELRCCGI